MSEFRLLTRSEMESVPGMLSPIPSSLFAMGIVDEQGVAAAIGVFMVIHADPIWIRPDKRGAGVLPLRLWEATRQEITERDLGPEVLVGITPDNPGPPIEQVIEKMVEFAGGQEVMARFFVLPTGEHDGERTADDGRVGRI
jgi:hypothetical protein